MKLSNSQHFVIVGGSKRLGFYLTQFFAKQGIRLTILYRQMSPELDQLCKQYPKTCRAYPFDLNQLAQFKTLAESIFQESGPIHLILTFASQFYKTSIETVTESQWDELFQTNVKGQFFLLQALLSKLQNPGGQIINLVDIFATKQLRGYVAYTAAKSAFLRTTKSLALELAPGIRVNAISPGSVLLPDSFSQEETQLHTERNLMKRLGAPEDILQAVLFLMESSYITGIDLAVDGGSSLI